MFNLILKSNKINKYISCIWFNMVVFVKKIDFISYKLMFKKIYCKLYKDD